MSSSDLAISVRGLSKSYIIAHNREKPTTLVEELFQRLRNPLKRQTTETFWALTDVSFDIKKGDVVGIIGRNGAGKSTLLKILSRITGPTSGEIDVYGRIGSLLEVGTGFHQELTGRENVYLNGAILGMRRWEIQKQFDAIVDFAGVEQFIDTPVKRYSSGMYVRLAFAVAAHLNPEILIVDEVLSVGDAEFQRRCLGKMKDVAKNGRTVLFVSHNLNAVMSLCNYALHLKRGSLVDSGELKEVVDRYVLAISSAPRYELVHHDGRTGGGDATFVAVQIQDDDGNESCTFRPEQTVVMRFTLNCATPITDPRIGVGVNNGRGERIFAVATFLGNTPSASVSGEVDAVVQFRVPPLLPGQYTLDISLSDGPTKFIDAVHSAAAFDVIDSNYLNTSHSYFSEMGPVMVRSTWSMTKQTPRIPQIA